jgi:PKD repeat protein
VFRPLKVLEIVLVIAFLWTIGAQAGEDGVSATITEPKPGATLDKDKGKHVIKALGKGFELCFYAYFEYSTQEKERWQWIGKASSTDAKTNFCTFEITWDISALPDGAYHIRVRIGGWDEHYQDKETPPAEVMVIIGEIIEDGPKDGPPQTCKELKADFDWEPDLPTTLDIIHFESLSEPQDRIIHYVWDFGDDTISLERFEERPTHNYKEAGRYSVTLTVTCEDGQVDTVTKQIEVRWPISIERELKAFPSLPEEGDVPPRTILGEDFRVTLRVEVNVAVTALTLKEGLHLLLFSLKDEGLVERIVSELRGGNIPEELREAFEESGFPLREEASLSQLDDDEWLITSDGQSFIIKGEEGKLRAYLYLQAQADGQDEWWTCSRWEWKASKDIRKVGFKESSLEWVLVGPIEEGTIITLNYYLEMEKVLEGKDAFMVEGNLNTPKNNVKSLELPAGEFKVVDELPLEIVLAHLKGEGCGPAALNNCKVDPLDGPDVSAEQLRMAERFWRDGIEVQDPDGRWKAIPSKVDQQLLLDLYCHHFNGWPVTQRCIDRAKAKPPRAIREIEAFPELGPDMLPQLLLGNVFRVEVTIKPDGNLSALGLDEEFDGQEGLPTGWGFIEETSEGEGCEHSVIPEGLAFDFKESTLEWVIKAEDGDLPDEITVIYCLKVPKEENVVSPEPYRITGEVIIGPESFAIATTSFRVVDVLPLRVVIAHIAHAEGRNCKTELDPRACMVGPLYDDPDGVERYDDLISKEQLEIAEAFWHNDDPEAPVVPYAEPNKITAQIYNELFCYWEHHTPITEDDCTAGPPPVPEPPPERPGRGGLTIKEAIAHIKGEGCRAASPEKCQLDAADDDLIDEEQLLIAQDFWRSDAALPWRGADGQPLYITYEVMLELACYYARKLPITESRCPTAKGYWQASAGRTIWAFPPLPPEDLLQALAGESIEITVTVEIGADLYVLGLDEDPPAGWEVLEQNWHSTQEIEIFSAFKGSTSQWIFAGMLPAGSSLTVDYRLMIPKESQGIVVLAGRLGDGSEVRFIGNKRLKVVDGLPIKLVIAHISGEGCSADSPERCRVDAKLDEFISDRQIEIAEEFWLKDVPVPYAVDSEGRQPAYITREVYLELICYYVNRLPVTNPSCNA